MPQGKLRHRDRARHPHHMSPSHLAVVGLCPMDPSHPPLGVVPPQPQPQSSSSPRTCARPLSPRAPPASCSWCLGQGDGCGVSVGCGGWSWQAGGTPRMVTPLQRLCTLTAGWGHPRISPAVGGRSVWGGPHGEHRAPSLTRRGQRHWCSAEGERKEKHPLLPTWEHPVLPLPPWGNRGTHGTRYSVLLPPRGN